MSVNFATKTTIRAIDHASKPLLKIQKQAAALQRSFRNVNKAASGLRGVGRRIMMGIGMPAVVAGANTLRMAADFDEAMNTTQSKLLISKKAMKKLRDEAKHLGATTQFSATQAGNAMSYLAQAGYDTNKIMKTTGSTLDLAAAGGLGLASAADIASNVMGAFRLDKTKDIDKFGENYKRVTSVLAVASAKSNLSVEELAEALKGAAPVAAQFGMSIEQSGAMLGMLANMGIKGSKAGKAMENMFVRLINPVGAGQKAMERFKITQSDFFDKAADGSKVFKGVSNMIDILKKKGVDEKGLFQIFGKFHTSKMMALISAGGDAVRELENDLKNYSAASKMADIKMQGLPGVFKLLASSWEAVNLAMKDSGAFDPIIEGIKKLTGWLQELSKHPETLKSIAKTVGMVVAAGAGLYAVGTAMKFFTTTVTAITLLSSPIGMVVAGIAVLAGLGVLIYKNWDGIKEWFVDIFNGLSEPVQNAIKFIKIAFVDNNIVQLIIKAWQVIPDFFSGMWQSVKSMFASGIVFILEKIRGLAGALQGDVFGKKIGFSDEMLGGLDQKIAKYQAIANQQPNQLPPFARIQAESTKEKQLTKQEAKEAFSNALKENVGLFSFDAVVNVDGQGNTTRRIGNKAPALASNAP